VNSGRPAKLTRIREKSFTRCSLGLARTMPPPIDHRPASHPERKLCPAPARNLSTPPPTSRVAFCASPICPATRSTGSAGTKQSFGPKSAKSCLPSTHWIAASHKTEGAVSVTVAGEICQPTDATTIELRGLGLAFDRHGTRRDGQTLGQQGHSKDYRPHLKQVMLGIVLDGADRPFASFLWPGNTADVTRLMPVVERLLKRFGITKVCVVADRGMISAATIAALEEQNIDYILGARERSMSEVRDQVIDDDGVAVPLLIPRQKGATELAIKDVTISGRRYVLCRNEEEAKKDAEARAALIASLERKLAHGDKTLVSNKGYRRFLATPRDDHFTIDSKRVAQDERFDGVFVLRTNAKMSALQVVLRYRNLLAVEDTFKTAKAILATRPIFHKTDAAIRGHVFCSFLAVLLRKELLDRVCSRRSWGPPR
jgi:Transposase DDE domain